MALSILVRLRHQRYDAATLRPSIPEWPPHPARVLSALVASAETEDDWAALRWLERAGEPQVWASPAADINVSRAVNYVVVNRTGKKHSSHFWPGRDTGLKTRTSVLPKDDGFAVVWPDATPDEATLRRLAHLARRVPYLGRSTSSAEVTVVAGTAERRETWAVFRPVPIGTPYSLDLRVPYPGYVDGLRDAYQEGRRPHEVSRLGAYAVDAGESPEPNGGPVRCPYPEMLIFRVRQPSVPYAGSNLLRVTEALRSAVMSRVPDPLPAAVSGHEADGVPHLAYLALPDVGHEHADGHLLGVAVALPDGMPEADRRTVVRALIHDDGGLRVLRVDRRTTVELEYHTARSGAWGLRPERWSGPPEGSTTWVTVSPVMLDRHPRRSLTEFDVVAKCLVTAGYPEPDIVELLPGSPIVGGLLRPVRDSIPQGRPIRRMVHCRVEFPEPVAGPVVAGSLRYLGCGLFVPERGGRADNE